ATSTLTVAPSTSSAFTPTIQRRFTGKSGTFIVRGSPPIGSDEGFGTHSVRYLRLRCSKVCDWARLTAAPSTSDQSKSFRIVGLPPNVRTVFKKRPRAVCTDDPTIATGKRAAITRYR